LIASPSGTLKKQPEIAIKAVKRRNNEVPFFEGRVITALPFLMSTDCGSGI